ncbi:hypothetical protein [Streptomyces sp. NPDC004266]|uniref:hypothetical protein n=1 Tax=Streptomyces sp. NPDC004266 TaxID=3364693 RepID=UPI0036D1E4B5
MNRRRGTDPPGEPLGSDNGLDADLGRKKKRRSQPRDPVVSYLISAVPRAGIVPKKPKKPKAAAAKSQKNPADRKQPKAVDAKQVAARLRRDAHNAKLDAALQDYERPMPDEVADIFIEIIRTRPPASGLPPRPPASGPAPRRRP